MGALSAARPMPRYITRAALADLAGVSRPAITKVCRTRLADACNRDRVDRDADCVRDYLAEHGVAADAPTPPTKPRQSGAGARTPSPKRAGSERARPTAGRPATPPSATDEELEAYAEALRPLLDRFGTERTFRDWLDALKKIEDIREKRLDNEQTEGSLISRELVKVHVFGAIDSLHRRLLADAPRTLASRLYADAKNGLPLEEAERTVRDIVSGQLEQVKKKASSVLLNDRDHKQRKGVARKSVRSTDDSSGDPEPFPMG